MLRLLLQLPVEEEAPPQLLLAPADGVWSGATPLPRDALLLLPDVSPLRALVSRLRENATSEQDEAAPPDPEDVAAAVGLGDILAVGRVLLRAHDLLREGLAAFCQRPASVPATTDERE